MTAKNANLYHRKKKERRGASGVLTNYGARPVKGVIQQMVENETVVGVLKGSFEEGTILVDTSSAPNAKKGYAPQKELVTRRICRNWCH